MGKTKSASSRSSEDEALPKWAEDEIKSVQFGEPEILTRTGYILDIYENDFKIDIKIVDFMKGVVYEFKIKMFHGSLSSKLVELLRTKFAIEMDTIYRFDLEEIQMMDVESDLPSIPPSSDGEDEDGEDGKE
ncbi:MAG: hypothetical protein K0R16_1697 [Nitrososphaeraceae archaeon]|nr:hypothetical protein [Nitrososphaeraceae archaeon]